MDARDGHLSPSVVDLRVDSPTLGAWSMSKGSPSSSSSVGESCVLVTSPRAPFVGGNTAVVIHVRIAAVYLVPLMRFPVLQPLAASSPCCSRLYPRVGRLSLH